MKQHNGHWHMELADAIRANRLIRGRIDFDAFAAWYHSLSLPQQCVLGAELFGCAHQAGVDDSTYDEVFRLTGLSPNDDSVLRACACGSMGCLNIGGLQTLLAELSGSARLTVFRLCVFLFGVAEGRVFSRETREHCNHWWHRDLLDERVVESLLADPTFYKTSMRDDDRIKKTGHNEQR